MPHNHTVPVVATVLSHDQLVSSAIRRPGAFAIATDGSHILCCCPCGCDSLLRLPIYVKGTPKALVTNRNNLGAAWAWDGNATTPTLEPSIRQLRRCFYHGSLVAGVWNPHADSGIERSTT